MVKKPILKVAAITVCLGFLLLVVPGLNSAQKKPSKFDFRAFFQKPLSLFSAIVPIFKDIINKNDSTPSIPSSTNNSTIKITGGTLIGRPSGGS